MSDASGVGAVTTPPPSKRGKKIGSYVDVSEDDAEGSNGSSDRPKKRGNGRARSASQNNGVAPAASKKEEAMKEDDEKDDDDDDDGGDDDEDEEECVSSEWLSTAGDRSVDRTQLLTCCCVDTRCRPS